MNTFLFYALAVLTGTFIHAIIKIQLDLRYLRKFEKAALEGVELWRLYMALAIVRSASLKDVLIPWRSLPAERAYKILTGGSAS